MKKIFGLLLAVMSLGALSACSGSDDETVINYTYNNNYTYTMNTGNNTEYIGGPASYAVKINFTKGTASIAISQLELAANLDPIKLELVDAKFEYDKYGALVVNVPVFVSTALGQSHEVTSFVFRHVSSTVPWVGIVVDSFDVSYVVDGNYVVRAVQASVMMQGQTEVTDLNNGSKSTQERPLYSYSLNRNSGKAKFTINSLAFGTTTPVEMRLEDVPYTINNKGIVFESTDNIVPMTYTSPMTGVVISNFKATTTFTPTMKVDFLINNPDGVQQYKVSADVSGSGAVLPAQQ